MSVNTEDTTLSIIEQLASVYFTVDKELCLSKPSALLRKYLYLNESSTDKQHLLDLFDVVRPNKLDSFRTLINAKSSMVLLTTKEGNFAIRGQFVSLTYDSEKLIFVGSPWLSWMNTNLPDIQLMMHDFKPVDPQLDQLILLSTERQNINDLQQLATELQIARDKAQAASQAQADFFAIMSHEMRTPLSGVVTALELLNNENLGEQASKMIDIAKSSSENLKYVVDHVLDYSKLQAGGFENNTRTFDFRMTVQSVINMIIPRASEQDTRLLLSIDPTVYEYIQADGAKVRQVLINMLSNAVKFTEKGSIHITAALIGDNRLKISVIDTGKGIPLSIQDKIFEPFLTFNANVSDKESGTGLGLNISQRLVKIMGGEIGFDSTPEKGSNFYFVIPVTKAVRPASSSVDKQETQAIRFSGHVLLVEDNKTNQYLNRLLLEERGLSVDVADDGLQAINMIESARYDAVFMDISMPVMDGITATGILRQTHSKEQLPIIAMTAHIGDSYQQRFIKAGMDDVITKPVDKTLLVKVLKNLFVNSVAKSISTAVTAKDTDQLYTASDQATSLSQSNQLLNNGVLEELLLSIGDEAFIRLTDLFTTEIISGIEEIINAHSIKDMALLADIVHTIISSAKATGCEALTEILLNIQHCSQQNKQAELTPLIEIIRHTATSSVDALQEFKKNRIVQF